MTESPEFIYGFDTWLTAPGSNNAKITVFVLLQTYIIALYYYQVLAKQGVEPSFPQNCYRRVQCKHTNISIGFKKLCLQFSEAYKNSSQLQKHNELCCVTSSVVLHTCGHV